MKTSPAANPLSGNDPKTDLSPAEVGWPLRRWIAVIALIYAAHLALVFLFGEEKMPAPRAVANVPTLSLAPMADERIALEDPTLFALPHRRDFSSPVWLKTPEVQPPSFRWTEPQRPLALPEEGLGATFLQMMKSHSPAISPLEFTPAPVLSLSPPWAESGPPKNSSLRIEGGLAQRLMSAPLHLTNWPYSELIAPSVVQVLVDPSGTVASTVLLPPGSGYAPTDQYDAADQYALALARTLHFTPASELTLGRIYFNWQTVPPPSAPHEP